MAMHRRIAAPTSRLSLRSQRPAPILHSVARWPKSMAQYTVGHEQRLRQLEGVVKEIPGLHLAGNAYRGIGLPDCVKSGKEAAARIIS